MMIRFFRERVLREIILPALVVGLTLVGEAKAGLTVVLNPGAGLASNAQALAAFNAAANEWSNAIDTNITVTINADLTGGFNNPGVIGTTFAEYVKGSYTTIRNAMVAHAVAAPSLAILSYLPTADRFLGFVPEGFGFTGNIALTTANAKALGFSVDSGADATITFNNQFAFAYTPDQLNGSTIDFQSVAAHEIGHVLGFTSSVDTVDYRLAIGSPGAFDMNPLDLFRFSAANMPTTAAEFANTPRSFLPSAAAVTSDTVNNFRMSTGVFLGDGRRASHWIDDRLTGTNLGIMDPTLGFGKSFTVGPNDLRARRN
jgi:hypothetical protein